MNSDELTCKKIDTGNASRYIKPRWVEDGKLSTEAFDLRDGSPPEPYVSHFLVDGSSIAEFFESARTIISTKITIPKNGWISIIDIVEALSEVNDDEHLIEFIEKNLPHCGLVYTTKNQENIQEAKATLCFIANIKPTQMLCEGRSDLKMNKIKIEYRSS